LEKPQSANNYPLSGSAGSGFGFRRNDLLWSWAVLCSYQMQLRAPQTTEVRHSFLLFVKRLKISEVTLIFNVITNHQETALL